MNPGVGMEVCLGSNERCFVSAPFYRSRWFWPCLIATLLFSIVWLWARAYQSHYISALRMLGDTISHAYWGHPREGRGDEWATYLPMLKQAYWEHFPYISTLPPYHERLEWFISIPHKDLSLFFLPNQLAYWIVPGGVALSFQGLYYNLLLIYSLAWFLRNLGVRTGLAIAAAGLLLFSQLYQLWWTSNFPALGAVFLPFAIMTSSIRMWVRIPFLAWSVAHVLLGQMYPPFYLVSAIALVPLIFAIRPDLFRWRYLALAGMAAASGLAVYLYLKWDFFIAVSHTTYPGHRVSTGGGGTFSMLLSALLPAYPTVATLSTGDPIYELSAASTVMSLLMFAALPTAKWNALQVRMGVVTLLVGLVMSVFMLAGFPVKLAMITGFSLIPTNRMQLGLSILIFVFSTVTVSYQWSRLRIRYILVALLAYACVLYFAHQPDYVLRELGGVKLFAGVALGVAILGACLSLVLPKYRGSSVIATVMLGSFFTLSVVTFGSFNPVMRASDIMRPVDTAFVRGWKQLYVLNGQQSFGIGSYGHVLRGENLPALEAIHMANVTPSVYAKLFPDLTKQEIEKTFNKFVGIAFSNIKSPDLRGVTVFLPIERYAMNFSATPQAIGEAGADVLAGPIKYNITSSGHGRFDVWWSGTLISGVAAQKRLLVSAPCAIFSSWLTREPSAYVGSDVSPLPVVEGHLGISASAEADAIACAKKIVAFVK
ncbi:MAG TPA: hypothetical protein VN633_06235 [Bryobacteraceae bacterium]|nr:hypothetical protein [Bryobacteraceae bacterium]